MPGKKIAKITRKVGRLVFSRFMIILLLFLLQIAVFVSILAWFSERLPWLTAVEQVFTVIMVLYLFNCRMDSSAKLTWMFLIALFPIPSALLLVYTRTEVGKREISRTYAQRIEETRGFISGNAEQVPQSISNLERYMNREGMFPVYEQAFVTYYPLGDEAIPAMIREMEKAEHFIFLEFFIISEGHVWDQVRDVLRRKAAEGVDVRVLYDGMCDVASLPTDFKSRLRREGIKVKAFFPLTAFVSTYYNYRDHRKILAIDNRVAFTGGVNLADEYANEIVRFGHWKDTAIRVEGEAARSFTLMFLQMWNLIETHRDYAPVHLAAPSGVPDVRKSPGLVLPFADCPLDGDKVGESVYLDMLYRAEKYVHIMTPYLILDGEMETALTYAAQRGVDVKIILPGIPDKKGAYALAKSHYRTLTMSGVHLYEYEPGFVHAKVVSSDDVKAVVGTINFDYRSLYHHFECALYMQGTECIADIEKDFADTLARCRPVTMESIRAEKLGYKLAGSVLKLVAPLM